MIESLIADRYLEVRQRSERICALLTLEDHVPQPVMEVSPPKWHLGHTAWFFEALLLERYGVGYRVYDPAYSYIFNSYYESQGSRVARDMRGSASIAKALMPVFAIASIPSLR